MTSVVSKLSPPEILRRDALEPGTRARAEQIVAGMNARGYDVYYGETARSVQQQNAAIEAGTTSATQKLTWHFLLRAVDFRKRLPDGKPDQTTRDEAFFLALAEEAIKTGCRSLAYRVDGNGNILRDSNGTPVKLLLKTTRGDVWDAGHVEYHGPFATLAQAVAAERPDLAHLA